MNGPTIRRRGDRLGGLPSRLPPGERILWQGRPDWRVLARRALHVRGLAFYLGLMLCWFAVADFRPSNAGRTLAGVLWRLSQPEPMLRAVPDAAEVARMLSDALAGTAPLAAAATAARVPVAAPEPVRVPEQVPA